MSPARPLFARRPRTLRYCCLSWGGAKASRNTLLRNGDKRRSHPRARRRLLYPEPICAPKETYSSAVVRLFKIAYHGTGRTIIARTLLVRSLTLPSARKSPILFRHRSSGRSSHCPRVNKHSTYVEAPRCSRSCGSSIQSPASPSPLVQRRSPRVRSLERGEYAPRHPRDVRYGALGAVAIGVGLTVGSSNLEPVHYHRPFMNSAISRLKREASSQNGE